MDPYATPVIITLDFVGGQMTITVDQAEHYPAADGGVGIRPAVGSVPQVLTIDAGVLATLIDTFREVNGYDCCKDALQCNGTTVSDPAKPVLNELIKCIVGDCPGGRAWPTSWQPNLKLKFAHIKTVTTAQFVEKVLERKVGCVVPGGAAEKLLHKIFLTECGVGPERIAAGSFSLASNCAQAKDDGPGSGTAGMEFPKVGSTIVIKENFYKLLGLSLSMELTAHTTGLRQYGYVINTGLKEYFEGLALPMQMSGKFSRLLAEKTIIRERSGVDPSQARTNNNWKNGKINDLAVYILQQGITVSTMVEFIIACENEHLINLFLDSLIGVLTKLLGDGDQSFLHFMLHNVLKDDNVGQYCISEDFVNVVRAQITELEAHGGGAVQSGGDAWVDGVGEHIEKYNTISTCDKTVAMRSVALGAPMVLTGGKDGLITGLEYISTPLPIADVLKNLLAVEVASIKKSFQKIKANISQIRADGIFYLVSSGRGIRYRQFYQNPDLETNLASIIHLLDEFDNDVDRIKDALRDSIDSDDITDVNGFIEVIADQEDAVDARSTPHRLRKYLLPEIITSLPNGQRGYIAVTLDPNTVPQRFNDLIVDLKRLVDGLGGGPTRTRKPVERAPTLVSVPAGKAALNPYDDYAIQKSKLNPKAVSDALTKSGVAKQIAETKVNTRAPVTRAETYFEPYVEPTHWDDPKAYGEKMQDVYNAPAGPLGDAPPAGQDHASFLDRAWASAEIAAAAIPGEIVNLEILADLDLNEKYLIYLININLPLPADEAAAVHRSVIVNILYNHSIYYLKKYRNVPINAVDVEDEAYSHMRCWRAVLHALSDYLGIEVEVTRAQISLPDPDALAAANHTEIWHSSGPDLQNNLSRWNGANPKRMRRGGAPKCQPCSTNEVYKPSKKKSIRKKKRKTNKKSKKKIIKKSPKYSKRKSIKKKSFKKSSKRNTLKKSKRKSKK